jgi:hypothetical protein
MRSEDGMLGREELRGAQAAAMSSVDGEAEEDLLNVVPSGTCKRNALVFTLTRRTHIITIISSPLTAHRSRFVRSHTYSQRYR